MNNKIPQLSQMICYYPMDKTNFLIHQTEFDHRVKISTELYQFLQLIDNEQDLESLVLVYNEKYKAGLTVAFANDFLYNKLAKFGIIECPDVIIKLNEKPNYLKLSFIIFSTKMVSKLTRYLKFLFFPNILKSLLILIVLLLLVCFYKYYNQILYANITKSDWLFFFLLSFIGVTFHEFGHASASDYFGAKHGGIGGGFYLFMPVYFADVTDIWKLPKQQRIVVNLAGMYFELIYASVLILLGFIFNHPLLIILACIFSMSSLRNLNPFARSDGYWILSDLLEKPNLMYHGFIKVKQILKSKKEWKTIDYFLMFYGLTSLSFILFFVYFVVIKNPNSILYFPQNVWHFAQSLFMDDMQFSVVSLGQLFIPIVFFYLVFNWARIFLGKLKQTKKH